MKPIALDYFVCIKCQNSLDLTVSEERNVPTFGKDIVSGTLTCTGCHKEYPITGGVPRFVDQSLTSADNTKTGEKFAQAWREFPRIIDLYSKQLFDWLNPVDPDFIKGKVVLEAGCGKGRHTKVIQESGAATVFGVDIGEAIDVANLNIGQLPNVHLAQADINNLPFKQCFDYAFSVGVLHHTDKPKNSFLSLVKTVRPGGSVSIWVYGKENNGWITNLLNPFRIFVTCKLPVAFTRFIAFVMASILFVWVNAVIRPWAQLQKALPFLPSFFYQDYLYYISEFDFNEIHHITFDHLVAPVAYYIPESEVRQWLNEAKLENTVIRWHNKNSWAGFGNVCSEKKELKTDLAKQKLQSVN